MESVGVSRESESVEVTACGGVRRARRQA
jgi:hypothetical protein